jgi:hypothetical protein
VANGARARAPAFGLIQVRESEIREREKKERGNKIGGWEKWRKKETGLVNPTRSFIENLPVGHKQ